MDTFWIKAFQLIVALLVLVTVHEFGHYFFSRLFGIKVNRFYLFFNPYFSLLKWDPRAGKIYLISNKEGEGKITLKVGKPHPVTDPEAKPTWRDTIYGIGWLPLGGYCDIAGMVDETKSADDLGEEVKPWEFRSKPAWQRLIVMVAGVLFNFLLAIAIYTGIAIHWGDKVVPYEAMTEGLDFIEPMHKAGFADGDILLAINGEPVNPLATGTSWDLIQPGARVKVLRNHVDTIEITADDQLLKDLLEANTAYMAMRVPVYIDDIMHGDGAQKGGIEANDRILKVGNDTTPSLSEFFPALQKNKGKTVDVLIARGEEVFTLPIEISDGGKIGVMLRPASKIYEIKEVKYNFFEAIPRGWEIGTGQLVNYVSSLRLIFTKEGAQSLGGFGTLGSIFPNSWNWLSFWEITALLSVILAFMNIIPIPALDGGYILFLFVEIIFRRKPGEKFIERANTVGFIFLLLLLLFANMNDIYRFVIK